MGDHTWPDRDDEKAWVAVQSIHFGYDVSFSSAEARADELGRQQEEKMGSLLDPWIAVLHCTFHVLIRSIILNTIYYIMMFVAVMIGCNVQCMLCQKHGYLNSRSRYIRPSLLAFQLVGGNANLFSSNWFVAKALARAGCFVGCLVCR